VISQLRSQTFDSLRREDYDSAEKLEAASQYLTESYQSLAVDDRKTQESEIIRERLSQARHNLRLKSKEWENIFAIFQNEQKDKKAKMRARQSEEELEFAEYWSNPAYMTSFTKQSHNLNLLRKQQRLFALAKDFESAKRMKSDADHLRRIETVTAKERAESSMKLARETMLARHRREVECFSEHQRKIEAYLARERQKAIEPIQRLVSQLEIARDRDKPLNMNPRAPSQTARRPRVMRMERPATRINPRDVCEFRFGDVSEPLAVGGVDVAKIVPTLRTKNSRRV
jgi:hypothetical protein